MPRVKMDQAARLRQTWGVPSRPACWVCGLAEEATIHGSDTWWQHVYQAGIFDQGATAWVKGL